MLTRFTLPDGSVMCIGDKVRGLQVKTIEFVLDPETKAAVATKLGPLCEKLVSPSDGGIVQREGSQGD